MLFSHAIGPLIPVVALILWGGPSIGIGIGIDTARRWGVCEYRQWRWERYICTYDAGWGVQGSWVRESPSTLPYLPLWD